MPCAHPFEKESLMFERTDLVSPKRARIHSGEMPSLHLPTVEALVNYQAPGGGEKPQVLLGPNGAGRPTFDIEPRQVKILDVRPIAAELSLEGNGVALLRSATAVTDFTDEERIRDKYYPEVEALLRLRADAQEVVIFDHTIRIEDGTPDQRSPVRRAHGDYTERSGPQRLRDLLPPERAAAWEGGHYAIVNVWRPFGGPVESAPLAFVDAASLQPGDLVATDLVYPDRLGEIFGLRHSDGQRWLYVSDMTPDEALLIKTFDSDVDARVRFVPHTAFDDPGTRPDAKPRRSIEVRALVRLDRG